jgi:hypothetical protein
MGNFRGFSAENILGILSIKMEFLGGAGVGNLGL